MKYWQITATKLAKLFQLNQTGPNSEKNSWHTDVSQSQTPPYSPEDFIESEGFKTQGYASPPKTLKS